VAHRLTKVEKSQEPRLLVLAISILHFWDLCVFVIEPPYKDSDPSLALDALGVSFLLRLINLPKNQAF